MRHRPGILAVTAMTAEAVIIRGGDPLTVRSPAQDPASARQAIHRPLPLVRAPVAGPRVAGSGGVSRFPRP